MERVDYEIMIVQDLLNFHNDGSLNISPWYQRRSVWSVPQKAYLINTIFEKKPVPSVYIRHQIDVDLEKSIKEVVDGQQRIRSIISFRNDEFPARHPEQKKKVKYSELSKGQKGAFLSTALSVGYLIGAEDRDVIEIFGRINSISKTLNPQEKRNAQYSGDFKQFSSESGSGAPALWRATDSSRPSISLGCKRSSSYPTSRSISSRDSAISVPRQSIATIKIMTRIFLEADEIADRMDDLFAKLAAIPASAFKDTVFKQYQLAFSLMVVVDRLRAQIVSSAKIEAVMRDIDERVAAYQDHEVKTDDQTSLVEGFTGGNLHRIKTRAIRDEVLAAAFA